MENIKRIYLSFDIEEFDMPKEYGYPIDFQEQIKISYDGLVKILDLLKKYDVKATFFSTVVFAQNASDLIKRLLAEGHELASHTYYHSDFEVNHLKMSKLALEEQFSTKVEGLRMPRMQDVDNQAVSDAGYVYNSSVNPTLLPGRYNKLGVSKTFFKEKIWQIPAAVSPFFRIPLFWLSFHNFPLFFYFFLLKRTLKVRKYATLYFHPWEFSAMNAKKFNFPAYVTNNSDEKMVIRFEKLLKFIQKQGFKTDLYKNLVKNHQN